MQVGLAEVNFCGAWLMCNTGTERYYLEAQFNIGPKCKEKKKRIHMSSRFINLDELEQGRITARTVPEVPRQSSGLIPNGPNVDSIPLRVRFTQKI